MSPTPSPSVTRQQAATLAAPRGGAVPCLDSTHPTTQHTLQYVYHTLPFHPSRSVQVPSSTGDTPRHIKQHHVSALIKPHHHYHTNISQQLVATATANVSGRAPNTGTTPAPPWPPLPVGTMVSTEDGARVREAAKVTVGALSLLDES